MKYAIIRLKGTQYKVSEKDEILIDKLKPKEEPVAEVLLVVDEDRMKIGKPKVTGTSVMLKVLSEEEKGKKITVLKFRAKSRYRRKIGFRPRYTRLLVEKIS